MPRRTGSRRTWADIISEAIMFGATDDEIADWSARHVAHNPWSWPNPCEALASRDPGQVRE